MEVSRLPLPDIRDDMLQYSFKRSTHRRAEEQRRPPKLNVRCTDAYFNRSHSSSFNANNSTAHAISFRGGASDDAGGESVCSSNKDETTPGFEESFTSLAKIGEGSFGEVFKVRSKSDGHLYAVKMSKQLFRSEHYRQERLEEARRCEQFSGHENCVRFYRAWEQNDRLYMQMELCRESLEHYLERRRNIAEEQIWSILLDLLLALKSLHDRNLIHLDIKLDNVLVGDDDSCKLADFGLVIDVDRANRHQATEGDSRYMAPEIMQGKFSKAADIFSLGIAMLELACYLELPSNGPLWQQLRSGALPEEFIQNISPGLLAIIKQMMAPDPRARPTVVQLLRHKEFVSMLQQRKRWHLVKTIRRSVLKTQRFAWSKLCEAKRQIVRFLACLLAALLSSWQLRLAVRQPPPAATTRPSALRPPTPLVALNGKLHTPRMQVIASTPTSAIEGGRTRLNNNNFIMLTTEENDGLEDDALSQEGTPGNNFATDMVINSTPFNHYSLRSRKDLTKTAFDAAGESPLNVRGVAAQTEKLPGSSSSSNFLCLEDYKEQRQSFILRKSLDTSSLVAKKLFPEYEEDN